LYKVGQNITIYIYLNKDRGLKDVTTKTVRNIP